jgi:hypothetical protein
MKVERRFGETERDLHAVCFMLVSYFAYSSTPNIEATYSSETSVDIQRTTRPHIPEDRTLRNHLCDNLKS